MPLRRIIIPLMVASLFSFIACNSSETSSPTQTPIPPPAPAPTPKEIPSSTTSSPSGTYVATLFGLQQTATFKGSTLELFNPLDGKRVFKYALNANKTQIELTNIADGKKSLL